MNKFLQEIFEQPAAIEALLNHYSKRDGISSLEKVKDILSSRKPKQIIFTGMGSSFFVSHAASTLFNEFKMNSFVVNTSELLHYNMPILDSETLLICTSQSGESYEVKELLSRLNKNDHCVGIVNDENSSLAKKSEIALLCKAGKEEKTSTKSYVVTSLVSFILGWHLAGKWDSIKEEAVKKLAVKFSSYINENKKITEEILAFLGDITTIQVIARGPAFSTACQSALMFREALQIPAAGILGGEFRHGPMEMVAEGFQSVLFAPAGRTFNQSIKMARDIAGFGGKVLLITNENVDLKNSKIKHIFLDEPDEYLFSVLSVVPVQLLIDMYAKVHGSEAGSFSRGAKVTETE